MIANTWVLLRHGQTNYHLEGRYQGHAPESVLSDFGIRQTIELREIARKLGVQESYRSPLLRAKQTFDILSDDLGPCSNTVANELTETAINGWENRLKVEIQQSDANSLFLWRNMPHIFVSRDGRKPLLDLYSEARSFLGNFTIPKRRLIIGHDHINRALIATLLDLPIDTHSSIPQATSSISIVVDQIETGRPALQVSNLEHVNGRAKCLEAVDEPRLILMRHGVTHANAARIYQGSENVPLSDLGRKQISMVEELIGHFRPRMIITSSLARAVESGALLPYSSSLLRNADCRLNEFHYGRWQGQNDRSVEHLYPEDLSAWRAMTTDRPIPDGESISHFVGRVSSILSELWNIARTGGTVLVISHDIVIRTIIAISLRLSTRKMWSFPISNAGLTELRMGALGQTILTRHNILAGAVEDRYGIEYL